MIEDRALTITRNGGSLEDLEAVRAIKGRDLAMRELGEEFGLFVVLEVDVAGGKVDLEAGKGGYGANLAVTESDRAHRAALYAYTHTLAVRLLGDSVEGADGRHFGRRGQGRERTESKECDLYFFSSICYHGPSTHVTRCLRAGASHSVVRIGSSSSLGRLSLRP